MSSNVLQRKKFKSHTINALKNENGEYKILVMKFNKGKKPDVDVISCVDLQSVLLEYDMIVNDIDMGIYKFGKHVKLTK